VFDATTWPGTGGTMKTGRRLLLAGLVGAALLTGCGDGATSAPGASGAAPTNAVATPASADTAAPGETKAPTGADTVDVCSLVTTDEVAAIVGKPVTIEPVEANEDWSAGECWWNSETMDVRFSVDVGTPATIAESTSPTTKEQLELFKIASMAPNAVDVSGVGDAAAFGNLLLVATKGESMVEVFNLPQDQAVAIATLVLAKL
jgi:hypothetical protein